MKSCTCSHGLQRMSPPDVVGPLAFLVPLPWGPLWFLLEKQTTVKGIAMEFDANIRWCPEDEPLRLWWSPSTSEISQHLLGNWHRIWKDITRWWSLTCCLVPTWGWPWVKCNNNYCVNCHETRYWNLCPPQDELCQFSWSLNVLCTPIIRSLFFCPLLRFKLTFQSTLFVLCV